MMLTALPLPSEPRRERQDLSWHSRSVLDAASEHVAGIGR